MATKTQEREEILMDLLKETKDLGVKGSDIDSLLGISAKNRSQIMRKLMRKYAPHIQNIAKSPKEGSVFIWVEDADKISKNHEGYSDPTPQKAIEPSKKIVSPKPGEIWSTAESNGASGLIFVLNNLNGAAQCIKLYQKSSESLKITGPDPLEIKVRNIPYIGDPTHATFKPLKYCVRRMQIELPGKLEEAKKRIALVYGIEAPGTDNNLRAEVDRLTKENKELAHAIDEWMAENHKLKEKLVDPFFSDLPPAKGVENFDYVDQKSVQIAVLTEQRDIWKEVAQSFLKGISSRESLPF